MKKLLLLLLLIFIFNTQSFAQAEDISEPKALLNDNDYKIKGRVEYDANGELFLDIDDVEKMKLNVGIPNKYPKKSVLNDKNLFSKVEEQRKLDVTHVDEYMITPTFNSLEYKSGNYTYGATFGTDMDTAQLEYRTKFFARYDNKIFGIMGALGKDAYTSSGIQMNSLYLAPEIKLSKSLTLVDTFKVNPDYDRYRNDIMLRYSPKIKNSRDRLNFEAGIGQTSYRSSGEQMYQFSVSTKFKF